MLRIHESRHTATLLHLSDGVQRQRCLTGTFRAIDLHHTALGIATTQGEIQGERSGGDRFHPHAGGIPQPHDRPFTEIALDLAEHQIQRLVALTG